MVFVLLSTLTAGSRSMAVDLVGYLPYYRMSGSYNANTLVDQLPLLDEIRYFGLTVNSSGAITPLSGSGSLATNLNRIATLKQAIEALPSEQRPRLDITLGGAGEAAAFQTVAASATLRDTLAQNVNALLNQSGATSVDIDWEHPSNAQNSAGTTERNNYSLMVQRLKQEVGASRKVYATMTPEIFMPTSAVQGEHAIDGISLMTYDLGWWGNDPANPLQGEHSVPQYAEDSLNAWTEPAGSHNDRNWVFPKWGNGMPAAVLGVGLPFYGRSITSSTAYTYAELVGGGSTTDGNYYNYAGQTVWIPGPELVEQRVEFAHDRGLKNIIIWEIGQDLHPSNPDSLLRRAYEKNQSFVVLPVPGDYDGNGSVGTEDYALWKSTFGATSGDMRADGNRDSIVDASDYTFWRDRFAASAAGAAAASSAIPEPSTMLQFGMFVTYVSFLYRRRGGSFA